MYFKVWDIFSKPTERVFLFLAGLVYRILQVVCFHHHIHGQHILRVHMDIHCGYSRGYHKTFHLCSHVDIH